MDKIQEDDPEEDKITDMSIEDTMMMTEENGKEEESTYTLDCYPYTFTPLLLFANEGYFDKGYSNYNSVAQFFSSVVPINMLDNVLYEKTNDLYEELLEKITKYETLVICCIDAHFTAFQVIKKGNSNNASPYMIYYDPCSPNLQRVSGESYKKLALYLLLKCGYGDSQHVQENKEYYTSLTANATRRLIYMLWKKIHQISSPAQVGQMSWKPTGLALKKYLLVNDPTQHRLMSTQLTGNTCYFQVFLFAVLCRVGGLSYTGGNAIEVADPERLRQTTIDMCRFLLTFFVQDHVRRPLTNSNILLDFFRYRNSPYYRTLTMYLQSQKIDIPEYSQQYHILRDYFFSTKVLHKYSKFSLDGAMSSTPNTKSLQWVSGTDDAVRKLAGSDYYKYRASNFMFGCNSNIIAGLTSFAEFNAWRKNQLLSLTVEPGCASALAEAKSPKGLVHKYRDYYFLPQFEIGQPELVNLHHYTFLIDQHALTDLETNLMTRIHAVNERLLNHVYFSTQKTHNYEKMQPLDLVRKSKKLHFSFLNAALTLEFFQRYVGLGFSEINPNEKDVNSLTQTVFYETDLMSMQANRQSYEFEKECINQMARTTLRKYNRRIEGARDLKQKYRMSLKIGQGFTFSKYNTLMHFLNVLECYWNNPDLSNIQVLGKDIRVLLVLSCQKIFFHKGHAGYYYYGPFEKSSSYSGYELDLAVASSMERVVPTVSEQKRGGYNHLIITDRVYEYDYLRNILSEMFRRMNGVRLKTDNEVLNLCLLSLMLDFGLYQEYAGLLHLPFLNCLQHRSDTRELQVEIANLIYEFDRKNTVDSVTRNRVEELIFETSYRFLVNKAFPLESRQFKLIQSLNSDPDYQSYVLFCKIYMSLCQINKSVEVDYYKVYCDSEFRIIIPQNYSKSTSDYLEKITKHYTFSERENIMMYDDLPIFDLRGPEQPEIKLFRIRFDSSTAIQSMVKYIEFKNVFRVLGSGDRYLVFIADNVLLVEVLQSSETSIKTNKIAVEVATVFFNEAISFIPCFKYSESEDVVLFTSRNIHCLVDKGGQFSTDYYGMKHELIECILSDEVFVDLNDDHLFKSFKLSELLTESKVVLYFPDYLLQVSDRSQLINLLDFAIHIRNVSFFILILFLLRRCSVSLEFIDDEKTTKISGPWREAILYVLGRAKPISHYDSIFKRQFVELDHHQDVPLKNFIDIVCENFVKYQRFIDGTYQIIPTNKQREFLNRIICAKECFHFSEVGSGKTKVILPLLCQIFLSNNKEAHYHFCRGGKAKNAIVILVPEHLVTDARTQVFRYCLNLNFREDYRIYDDIFSLLHNKVVLSGATKQIFVTTFNQFKKALTYNEICAKVQPYRDNILVIADEVDDFLNRDKLVFNICSNKNNSFDGSTIELFFQACRAAYNGIRFLEHRFIEASSNPDYWIELQKKFSAIHAEIQDASRSINKSFGIFNEYTLRHCSSNIVHDIEGYKSLIARPYESVNRAMPGSYFSDVERTIYLTYVILVEDIAKYDGLFQEERKFISFEYWNQYFIHQLDFDDLVYGHEKLSEIVEKHPETKDGLIRFLFEIILRRMEIRDKSRSVNSIDVIFNFDCLGFTGTPFLDNYPTFSYIRDKRHDEIPDMIDRSFYAYTSEVLTTDEFERRFTQFQGQNTNVLVEYVSSDIMCESKDEMEILEWIFSREQNGNIINASSNKLQSTATGVNSVDFNVIVDLCGIFKRSTIHDICEQIKKHFGSDCFHYIYHIDQSDNSDRVLCIKSGNDVQYDEEFYNYLSKTYKAGLRDKIFFFVDNRNVIGKDIPFQLVYQRHFGLPLFSKSVVLAHDVDDFSSIWQAMGRSRTMSETIFTIYKSGISDEMTDRPANAIDIREQELTRHLYISNCDRKMAGNISSIYFTLIALHNLSQASFYFCDEIVNTFLEKMQETIQPKLLLHEKQLVTSVLGSRQSARIFLHILSDKFRRSAQETVVSAKLTNGVVESILRNIVQQKFEQRKHSGDEMDEFISFLSGEQQSQLEISYTKQHQKQKTKQHNKNQDSDAMGVFEKQNQLTISDETENYFDYSLNPSRDFAKICLNLPATVPILTVKYNICGEKSVITLYPTLQFLYSHHIHGTYINEEVKDCFQIMQKDPVQFCERFLRSADSALNQLKEDNLRFNGHSKPKSGCDVNVILNHIRQNPQYTIAALRTGIYIIGTKDQFNIHDLKCNPMREHIMYIADDTGFILFDKMNEKSVDNFGPYFIEQYILLELLSKHEMAQNVLRYYCSQKELLKRAIETYSEKQGKGFICWRFLMNETVKTTVNET